MEGIGIVSVCKKLARSGNSIAIVIPRTVLEMLGWEEAMQVQLTVEGNRLVIERRRPKLFGSSEE